MIVLDASAALELLSNSRSGKRITEIALANGISLHAPHLIDIEITHALRRYLLAQTISLEQAESALDAWRRITITRHSHIPFLGAVWRHRNNLSAYDAAYVALAESLGAMLVTCDRRLGKAPGVGVRVEVIQ